MGQFFSFIPEKCKLYSANIISCICPRKKKFGYIPMEFFDEEQHATIMTSDEIYSLIQKHQEFEEQKNKKEYSMLKSDENDEENLLKADFVTIKNELDIDGIDENSNKNILTDDNNEEVDSHKEINDNIEDLKNEVLNS